MTAFYLGSSESPLFGYLHRPSGPARGAVVLCSALSTEEQFSHQSLVWLGERLAQERFTSLRFDYRGTGDSWGTLADVSMRMWTEDVKSAIAFLKSDVGDKPLHGFGIRTGANLLRRCAAECDTLDRVIYLDPVESGARWLSDHSRDPDEVPDGRRDFAGWHELSANLYQELQALTWPLPESHTDKTALFVSTGPSCSKGSSPWSEQYIHRPGPRPHLEIGSTGVAPVPVRMLRELVSWIAS